VRPFDILGKLRKVTLEFQINMLGKWDKPYKNDGAIKNEMGTKTQNHRIRSI
jgi:hypothetical protein